MISAEEWQLISFFEVIPVPSDPDEDWPYNDYLFQVKRGETILSCAIAPAYHDVRLILSLRGKKVFELNAMDIVDIRYNKDNEGETLEIALSERNILFVRLNPEMMIDQTLSEDKSRVH